MMNCTWSELRQGPWHTDSLLTYIDQQALYLEESQIRNYAKWPVLGTYLWPNNFIGNSYAEEIDYLKTWLVERANWMDANMFGTCDDLGIPNLNETVYRVFPNPARTIITVESNEKINDAQIFLIDVAGKLVHSQKINNVFSVKLDISYLEKGIYNYKIIESNQNVRLGKIAIQ